MSIYVHHRLSLGRSTEGSGRVSGSTIASSVPFASMHNQPYLSDVHRRDVALPAYFFLTANTSSIHKLSRARTLCKSCGWAWLTVLVFLLATSFRARFVADSISSLALKGDVIVITVPTTIVGADSGLMSRWLQAIERAVELRERRRTFCRVRPRRPVRPPFSRAHESASDAADSHLVIVETVRDGQSYVSRVSYAIGTSPSYSPRTGSWGSNMDAGTVAHEFGHLLGLLDEYVENDVNRSGHREPGEDPRPDLARYPDGFFSLMAVERGAVLPRHVREVVRMHGGRASPRLSLTGFVRACVRD